VHDSVGSDETPDQDLTDFSADEPIGREDQRPVPAAPKEGLPKRFRMRHGRHYVDELLGDAPIRTVREIPISEIEPPSDEALDLEPLEGSIRRLGVLEPLLVIRRGLEYRVVAGMRRLRAARTVGLSTVPCLVQDIDEEKAMELRDAVAGRLAPPVHVPIRPVSDEPLDADVRAADAVVDAPAPETVPSIEPEAIEPEAIEPGLRRAVLGDLAAVESLRVKIASAAGDILSRTIAIERAPSSPAALVAEAAAAVALEARLRGVRVDVIGPEGEAPISLDAPQCRTVLTGMLQALLALVDRGGTVLEIHTQLTHVRPALIVECRLVHDGSDLPIAGDDLMARFFDAAWTGHPCGAAGAVTLAALMRIARAHGGRVQVTHTTVTFVIPRPLSDF
jgi:hypothetical protein